MSDLSIPFNIDLLYLDEEKLAGLIPVTSLDMFDGMSKDLNNDGLFSIYIFGRVGSAARSSRYSYIDIKAKVFHPVVFRALVQLKSLYGEIIQGKSYAVWDNEIKDFVKSNQLDGQTGFHFFEEHWKEIQFEERPSDIRHINIELVKKYKDTCMTDKIIVMPAGLRDIEVEDDGRISVNEINALYKRVLSLSNTISPISVKENIEMLDGVRYSIQMTFNQIYDLIESLIKGKRKLLMGKWASRRIHNGTRNVITSMELKSDHLNSPGNIGFNHTVCGLYQYIKAMGKITVFNLRNGFLSSVFSSVQSPAVLVNKKTLKKEHVKVDSEIFDQWMSDEGLEKVITLYGEESLRHSELEVNGYYLGLIYKGPGVFKIFQDIDELPEGLDKKYVTPLTFTELIYISVYKDSDKYPALVTRYPVTGFGSIYVSNIYLKPTLKTEERKPLGDDWLTSDYLPTAYSFPTLSEFVNSMSPHPTKLQKLGADII